MVDGVVTQSGGYITVESEPHVGTRFVIYLPTARDTQQRHEEPTLVSTASGGTETILLVEDDPAIRTLARRVLTGYGYQILEAADTTDAVRIVHRHAGAIDLLLSDIVMPKMNGPELAQHLVALRPDMRVLYMSGFSSRLSIGLGFVSPAVAVLHKPFTAEMLVMKVRQSLTYRHHAIERRASH